MKDVEKGLLVGEVEQVFVTIKMIKGFLDCGCFLSVVRNGLATAKVKFLVRNGPGDTSIQIPLLIALLRWHVERCFEDQQQES